MSTFETSRDVRHSRFSFAVRIAAAGALTCLLAPAAMAGVKADVSVVSNSLVTSRVVKYDELDLAKPAGAARLYARLQNAAESVCGARAYTQHLELRALREECVADALANAVEKVNHARVSALHAAAARVRVAEAQS